jgi:hypothetical protein
MLSIIQEPSPCPRCASSTKTSQIQAYVTPSVTTRAKAACRAPRVRRVVVDRVVR